MAAFERNPVDILIIKTNGVNFYNAVDIVDPHWVERKGSMVYTGSHSTTHLGLG